LLSGAKTNNARDATKHITAHNMTRSLKKGPYIDERLQKKILKSDPASSDTIKTWARRAVITPEMVGFKIGVHNGKDHVIVRITEEMVGHKLGEFSQTRKFVKHGGKLQRAVEQDAAPKAAPAATTPK